MKKIFALLLVILITLCLSAPLLAAAETTAETAPETDREIISEPKDAPTVWTATEAAQETEPGGIDLTPLMQAVVSLSVTLITVYLIPWLRAKYTAEERARIEAVYNTIVFAAEQLFGAGKGAEKLEWAVKQLEARGIKVDRPAIEAEVRRFFQFGKMLYTEETETTETTATETTVEADEAPAGPPPLYPDNTTAEA